MLVLLISSELCGCESYSTPYLEEQGRLNDRYKNGQVSKEEYELALSRQRELPWGTTGEAKPRQYQTSF